MQIDSEKLQAYYADAPDDIALSDIDIARIPHHVSIIMDLTAPKAMSQASHHCAKP